MPKFCNKMVMICPGHRWELRNKTQLTYCDRNFLIIWNCIKRPWENPTLEYQLLPKNSCIMMANEIFTNKFIPKDNRKIEMTNNPILPIVKGILLNKRERKHYLLAEVIIISHLIMMWTVLLYVIQTKPHNSDTYMGIS